MNNLSLEKICEDSIHLGKMLEEKKAIDVKVFNVEQNIGYTSAFVVASSISPLHTNSLENFVQNYFQNTPYQKRNPRNMIAENPWLVMDYGDIIVHILHPDARQFYSLDEIWNHTTQIYPHNE